MVNSTCIPIEIVYATNSKKHTLLKLTIAPTCTAENAILQSGILMLHPEIDLHKNKIGIFGHLIQLDTIIKKNDRIEIYKPLPLDPKKARKERVKLNHSSLKNKK